jgi:hypothetical protein
VCCVIAGDNYKLSQSEFELVGIAFVAEEEASLQVNVQTVRAGIAF